MSEIRNLKKLSKRLLKAIAQKERMVFYLDADLDGTIAAIILKEAISNLGGQVCKLYFSDRRREEAGLNKTALASLKGFSPALLVLLDCGISNFDEVELAKKMGFEVLIVDHHEILGQAPKASIIVDPKQDKDEFFYDLAAAGLAFKLAEELLGKKLKASLRESFIELAALATISDMVPEKGENVAIVKEGLPLLENSWRPGVRVLFNSSVVKNCFSSREIVGKIVSIINVTDKEEETGELYLLLNSLSLAEAQSRLDKFLQKASERQLEIEKWVAELKRRVSLQNQEPFIFEGSKDIPQPLLGTIASHVCDFFERPTFLYKETDSENIGHFRMPPGVNGIEALGFCARLLRRYGGHAPAGGFYFREKDGEALRQSLIKYFEERR